MWLIVHEEMGLVSQFSGRDFASLPGRLAIGHVRYSTSGASETRNAAARTHARCSFIALAHNGNLVNTDELREDLLRNGQALRAPPHRGHRRPVGRTPVAGHAGRLRDVIPRRGAFSAVLMTDHEVMGFRDPYGIRPLVLGRLETATSAMDRPTASISSEPGLIREIEPKSLVTNEDGYEIEQVVDRKRLPAPASSNSSILRDRTLQMKSQTLYEARSRMGAQLAVEAPSWTPTCESWPPDNAASARYGYGDERHTLRRDPHQESLYRPDDTPMTRCAKVSASPNFDLGHQRQAPGQVDDSIVRGTNYPGAGSGAAWRPGQRAALTHHFTSDSALHASPASTWPIKTSSSPSERVEDVSLGVGSDSVYYLSLEGLMKATGVGERPASARPVSAELPLRGAGAALGCSKVRYEDSVCGAVGTSRGRLETGFCSAFIISADRFIDLNAPAARIS